LVVPITPASTGPDTDADADLQLLTAAGVGAARDLLAHGQGQLGDRLGVVGARLGQPPETTAVPQVTDRQDHNLIGPLALCKLPEPKACRPPTLLRRW
jgi:hypothetical protein